MKILIHDMWTLVNRRPWMLLWPALSIWWIVTPREERIEYIRKALKEDDAP